MLYVIIKETETKMNAKEITELNELASKKNRTPKEQETLRKLLLKEKLEYECRFHPEDFKVL